MSNETSFNRLKDENSRYLKQHAENPVHWWSYGPDAIQKAKDENKPIFLSVGYSSCHWCHVMAEESFCNAEVAGFLNENFICIKVDKEEYPDIDNYYQQASHLFTQSGGWPLSAFLLPDMRPYFTGTYFPINPKEGETGFGSLINELNRVFKDDYKQAEENATKVSEAIEQGLTPQDAVEFEGHFPAPSSIMEAVKQFQDNENGGYGASPKFPNFSFYEWALEQMLEGMIPKEQGDHIIKSLEKMMMGGLFDQARGGIHRYTVDKSWQVPHFEKMLYDQAGCLRVLSKLSLLYPSPLVYDNLMNTMDYLANEMMSENKFFFSAQDADSEGVEGLYFTYSEEEFEDALNNADDEDEQLSKNLDKIKSWFNVTKEGNFEKGLNILSLNYDKKEEFYQKENWDLIRRAKSAIIADRKNRIPPATDSKGIASWNFMIISALADVMHYCQIDVIKKMAFDLFNISLEGVYNNFLVSKDNEGMKIKHSTTLESSLPYLEDYVNFSECQLRVYELTGNEVFKDNFKDTLSFIANEFVVDGKIKTRAKTTNEHELYPNQVSSTFDQSFKSSAATFVHLTRKATVLFKDKELSSSIQDVMENMANESLKNPLGSGEALRALTYPEQAYRVVKAPRSWLDQQEFQSFIPYFMSRFTLDYHNDDNQKWEISTVESSEVSGEGLKNLLETLAPNNENEDK